MKSGMRVTEQDMSELVLIKGARNGIINEGGRDTASFLVITIVRRKP